MSERLHHIVLGIVEALDPQVKRDHFSAMVLNGVPDDVWGRCESGELDKVSEVLSTNLGRPIVKSSSGRRDTSGHVSLWDVNTDEIIDLTAGQFIPPSSREGYEQYFVGNAFIGSRETLREICMHGMINTSTADDPALSFDRIWGNEGRCWTKK